MWGGRFILKNDLFRCEASFKVMSMNSADLRVFEAVARHGGIGKAARELGTVQSNVTARILALEEAVGRPLFFRHARGVSLTRAGETLRPYAVRVAQLLAEAGRALSNDAPSGALVIGSLETTAAVRMSPVLIRYRKQYPEVELTLRTGSSADLVQEVLSYALEGAFVVGPVHHPHLVEEAVFDEELVLVSAPSRADLRAALRCEGVVVFRAGCSYRRMLDAYLSERGISMPRRLEFGTLDGILGCVAADLGVTLLPRSVAESTRHRVKMHEMPKKVADVQTVFIQRRDALASRALVEFVGCAKSHGGARAA